MKEGILLRFWLKLYALLEFDSLLLLHMQVNIVISKWHAPNLYIGHDLALCSNICLANKRNIEVALHLVDDQSSNTIEDNFKTILDIIGLNKAQAMLVLRHQNCRYIHQQIK